MQAEIGFPIPSLRKKYMLIKAVGSIPGKGWKDHLLRKGLSGSNVGQLDPVAAVLFGLE
jgi:hypothetical protein